MQRMAELVEQGARIVEAQQRRFAVGSLGEVAHIDDQRPNVAGELFLVAQRGHPGAAALGRARKIVAEEQADLGAIAAAHLPDAHVGMPHRHIGALGEAQPEQAFRRVEGGLDHPLEIEVRLDRGLIDVAASLAQLLGVVAPVPGREREVAAFFLHQLLQRVAVGLGLRPRPRPHRVEQPAHGRLRLRHGVVEAVVGEIGIAEQAGALGAQPHHLGDDRPCCRSHRHCRRARRRRGRPFREDRGARRIPGTARRSNATA